MRYVNHRSVEPNAEFFHTEYSPYLQLRLVRPVKANEESQQTTGAATPTCTGRGDFDAERSGGG